MKKLFLFVFAAIAFVACTQNDVEELSSNRVYLPDEISVGFENNDETRVQLHEGKSVWNAGDLVSVFYKTIDNLMWEFQGEDGDRTGLLKMIEGSVGKQKMSEVVVIYPYNQDYILAINNRSVEAKMPAKQEYRYESYDPACNLMIATSEGRDFILRNTCGWLKIELTGDGQQVEKLTLRGNNGETVAGDVTIDWDSSKATFISNGTTDPDDTEVGGSIVFDDASYDKLELNCHSAVLSSEPTAFYFTLPEQHFADGITVEVKCRGYKSMVLSTDDAVEIKRNHIKPMATVEFEAEEGEGSEIPNNEIWYTATEQIWPNYVDDFDATLVGNYYNSATGEGILEFDGELTRIPNDAFFASSLTSITIPDSVTTIGVAAFYYCTDLVEFNGKFASEDGRCLIVDGTLNSFAIGCGATEYTIPDSVTTIGQEAFADCNSLTSITIPDSVTTIEVLAFSCCTNLTEFKGKFASEDGRCLIVDGTLNSFAIGCGATEYTIPDSVTTIGQEAFAHCRSLTSITIPDSVTTIGPEAFAHCRSLTSVTIPDSVTTIGWDAFDCCSSLTSVYCEATTPPSLGRNIFDFNASGRKIYVPEESVHQYKIAAGWSDYADAIVGYDFENGNEEVFGKLPHEQFEVNLEVSGISATSVTVKATPNSSENRYLFRILTAYELNAFGIYDNDLEIFNYIIENPSSNDYIFTGTTTLDWATAAETKYLAVAFNMESYQQVVNGEVEVRLFRKEFETPRGEQVDPNSLFAVSNLTVSYDNFSLDVTPLKGENSFWSYYIWTKENYEETLNNGAQANIVMHSYWGLNNIGVFAGFDFGTFIKEYMGQTGSSQILAYEPLKNDTEYVVVLFYMDPEASDPTVVYDYNYVAVEFKTLAPSAEDYATLEVTGPYIEDEGDKYNVFFNVKTNDKAADIKVGAQLWANYDFEQYWDETDWSQIQAFFFFRTSVSAESLAAAKTEEGATVSFTGFDKNDYVFFFEALTEDNTPTQYAIRVTPEMFE